MNKVKQINNLIRGEMKEKKVTQNDLSYYIGLDQSSFSLSLSGKREWKIKELLGICEYLNISNDIAEIIGG